MENKFDKIVIFVIVCIFGWAILSGVDSKLKQVNEFENKILKLEEENAALLNDKNYYRERYISLANEINEWFFEHNIDKYILTDTDR